MRVVKADWEKRNLGVSCTEIEISSNDSVETVTDALRQNKDEYMVIKVPYGLVDIGLAVQNEGFKYIESNIQLELKMKEKPVLPTIYKRYESFVDVHEASEKEISEVLNAIRSGEIFTTDKVALDPFFSAEQSGRRYAFWTEDLLNAGNCKLNVSSYKNDIIAFGVIINREKYYDAFLGGLFNKSSARGLGFVPIYANTISSFNNGGLCVKTGVSSNNLPILKLHMLLGYHIQELSSIYIKHN